MTLEEAVYIPRGDILQPTELARGPWDANAQHGGASAALIGWALERAIDDPEQQVTRVNLDLLRPVSLRPLTVTVHRTGGRSVGRWEVSLEADGQRLMHGLALSCPTRPLHAVGASFQDRLAFPDSDDRLRIPGMLDHRSFHYTAMSTRLAEGSVAAPGPASVWFRLSCPLVAGESVTPLSRALAAADFGSGISWELPFERYAYVNADLSVHLHRLPRGEWIGVAARMTVEPHGVGLAESALYDSEGRIGTALQTLVVREETQRSADQPVAEREAEGRQRVGQES